MERAAWTAGTVALTVWAAANVAGYVGARHERSRFAALQIGAASAPSSPDRRLLPSAFTRLLPSPDTRLWSPERIRAWLDIEHQPAPPPLGVLRIPRLGIEVALLDGTDEWTLNRAVGVIEETARPGSAGNIGLAGHRDGFFRALKDIQADDVLEIETISRIDRYRVERFWIVGPDDVSVLDPTPSPAVTLVTCYPFYFVGSAPQRFIVRAVRTDS
jgi:sortase A